MTILMLIGLKHYFLLYPDQSHVQLPYLRFLCGMVHVLSVQLKCIDLNLHFCRKIPIGIR